MFNGVPPEQQFHQFIASRTNALPLPLPLTLPLHVSPLPPPFSIHELHQQQQPSHQQQLFQSHLLHTLQAQGRQPSAPTTTTPTHEVEHKQEEKEEEQERVVGGGHLELDHQQRARSAPEVMDPWLKEEVLALLTIRSSMGNDFSDFIWGHVSRKLAELGYKRSADKCKEKFEEVSKYCSNTSYGNYYRSFNELEALFQNQNLKSSLDETNNNNMVRSNNDEAEKNISVNVEENSANETLENPIMDNQHGAKRQKRKKRNKHDDKIEMLKEFSEFVGNVLVQQEELHQRFLEDIEKREAQRVAKEDAWRKKEMERLSQELEIRAKEQAIACERQVHIIELLKKVASSFPTQPKGTLIVHNNEAIPNEDGNTSSKSANSPTSPSNVPALNPKSLYKATTANNPNSPSSSTKAALSPQNQLALIAQDNTTVPNSCTQETPSPQNPTSLITTTQTTRDLTSLSTQIPALPNPNFTSNIEREDHGKRWPREEVNSLINLRCNLQNIGEDTKAPLWERISQGMLELGYKRSAKKCKEKWENINKYFRKTKDANKKRSIDSKTCPYFHQLNTLYNQGRLTSPSEGAAPVENEPSSPKTRSAETGCGVGGSSSQQADQATKMVTVDEGEKNMVQVSPLEFEY